METQYGKTLMYIVFQIQNDSVRHKYQVLLKNDLKTQNSIPYNSGCMRTDFCKKRLSFLN